ncbi:MAG: hypothetical protein M3Z04_15045 [Chloroflexota bacterium]|nr:hypothetical protein [Chloroflexota bacterium]
MPRAVDERQTAQLRELQALTAHPAEQRQMALGLLVPTAGIRVVQAALRALAGTVDDAARPVLLRQYAHYAADGVKRDPGTGLRVAILHVLRPLAGYPDLSLLETATLTYEFLPPTRSEAAHELRAAALVILHDLDPPRAAFQAVRLLADKHTALMSGEPAVTAVRILAADGHLLPLYYYATHTTPAVSEVLSGSLRALTELPDSLLPAIIERCAGSEDEIVLAGLFDLLLGHATRATHYPRVRAFLRTTHYYDVYRYLVTSIVADHKTTLLPAVLELAAAERDPRRIEILLPALDLLGTDPAVAAVIAQLRSRLPPNRPGRL